MSGGTFGYQGTGQLALEFPAGVDLSRSVGPSPAGRARIRYNDVTKGLEASIDGAAYVPMSLGGSSGWTDDGAIVRLTTASDSVAIGTATLSGAEKVRIIDTPAAFDTVLRVEASGEATFSSGITIDRVRVGVIAPATGIVGQQVNLVGAAGDGAGSAMAAYISTVTKNGSPAIACGHRLSSFAPGVDQFDVAMEGTNTQLVFQTFAGTAGATYPVVLRGSDGFSAGVSPGSDVRIEVGNGLGGGANGSVFWALNGGATFARMFSDGDFVIGGSAMSGTERFRVVGETRMEGPLAVVASGNFTVGGFCRVFGSDGDAVFGGLAMSGGGEKVHIVGETLLSGAGFLSIDERPGDPGGTANRGKLYTKDVAGVTELFYQRSDGTTMKLT